MCYVFSIMFSYHRESVEIITIAVMCGTVLCFAFMLSHQINSRLMIIVLVISFSCRHSHTHILGSLFGEENIISTMHTRSSPKSSIGGASSELFFFSLSLGVLLSLFSIAWKLYLLTASVFGHTVIKNVFKRFF